MADDTGTQYAGLTPDERTLARAHPHMATCDAPDIADCPPCRVVLDRIRRDLAALAAAGRLVPAGGKTREDWAVSRQILDKGRYITPAASRADAEQTAQRWADDPTNREIQTVRRRRWYGPWRAADDA